MNKPRFLAMLNPGSKKSTATSYLHGSSLPLRQLDRVAGVLVGAELGSFVRRDSVDCGEDTQLAISVAEIAATGADLRDKEALNAISEHFGNQLSSRADFLRDPFRQSGAALICAGIVAVSYLTDRKAAAKAARAVSRLVASDPLLADACVIWAEAIRRAVLEGDFADLRSGLDLLRYDRREQWMSWFTESERGLFAIPTSRSHAVWTLQTAWSAVVRTPIPPDNLADRSFRCEHFMHSLESVSECGLVAATAGALLGARWGVSAVPFRWLRRLQEQPDFRTWNLIRLSVLASTHGRDDERGWPSTTNRRPSSGTRRRATVHPADNGVLLGDLEADDKNVDAVVSLCHVGRDDFEDIPAGDHVEIWLVDSADDNNNLEYAIDQAARLVVQLRAEGKRVLVHCYAGQSRTPSVGARYTTLIGDVHPARAFGDIASATGRPADLVNYELRGAVHRLAGYAVSSQ